MSIGGGFCIANDKCVYDTEGDCIPVRRLWLVNGLGDELAIFVDDVLGACIPLRGYVGFYGSTAFWKRTSKSTIRLSIYGHPFNPCGRKLLRVV